MFAGQELNLAMPYTPIWHVQTCYTSVLQLVPLNHQAHCQISAVQNWTFLYSVSNYVFFASNISALFCR